MEDNHTHLLEEYGRDMARVVLPIDILLSIVLVTGIIGNMFVIFIFATKMRKNQRGSRYFIPFLAFCDLIVCIMSEILLITNSQHWISFHSDELCKTLFFFLLQSMMMSDAFLLAISVQRFLKICRPTAKQMTLYWRRITVVLVIVTNTLYSVPIPIVSGIQELSVVYRNVTITGPTCVTANHKYPSFQLICYVIVTLIILSNIVATLGLYTPIACVIYRFSRKRRLQQRPGTNMAHVDKANSPKTRFNLMLFVIISVYTVSYLPTVVMNTYITLDKSVWATSSHDEIRSYRFLTRTYLFNHVTNPFIYAYFDSKIRLHMTCSFSSVCPCSKTWSDTDTFCFLDCCAVFTMTICVVKPKAE